MLSLLSDMSENTHRSNTEIEGGDIMNREHLQCVNKTHELSICRRRSINGVLVPAI